MVYRTFKAIASLALLLVAAACGGSQTEVKEPEGDTGTPAVETPPPPPKCESLDEKCASKGDKTVAKVKSADLSFTPAEKWIYAQGEAQTIAQASDEGAVVVFGSYAPDKDAKKDTAARDAALAELIKAAAITLPKGAKINWKQKPDNQEVNGIKLNVWNLPGAERAKKKGTLLVLQAPLADDKALLALGFAADDDEAGMGAVSKAIESIKAGKADDKKADDKKSDGEKK
ncbi:hypothetical protein [Polyangium sp. y55x31]|uniref:hypothetical protein n=1 Tax=Polyangium sp. y55x31 TaxID=3042688 RepID=UPI0024824055|nr:hypothetical protein [Polyangium sp. y55x31]MDI1476902.1 hypothetical protein [Polyangium sp. y55x31]